MLFIGTANFIESELEGLRPDVAVVAIGLREKIPDLPAPVSLLPVGDRVGSEAGREVLADDRIGLRAE